MNGNPPWITVQRVTDQGTWLRSPRASSCAAGAASKYYRLYFENDAQHNDIGGIDWFGARCVVVLAELELFSVPHAAAGASADAGADAVAAAADRLHLNGTVPVTLVELFEQVPFFGDKTSARARRHPLR